MIRSYRDLVVWQHSMDLVVRCYQVARALPASELYGLSSQIRRAVVSVPANLAEGHGRSHTREYLHHVSIAYGSLMELETHLLVAVRLNMIASETADPLLSAASDIGRMLNALQASLRKRKL